MAKIRRYTSRITIRFAGTVPLKSSRPCFYLQFNCSNAMPLLSSPFFGLYILFIGSLSFASPVTVPSDGSYCLRTPSPLWCIVQCAHLFSAENEPHHLSYLWILQNIFNYFHDRLVPSCLFRIDHYQEPVWLSRGSGGQKPAGVWSQREHPLQDRRPSGDLAQLPALPGGHCT